MHPSSVRILFLADSHLGFDLPVHPRVDRRRRGHDFLANHERALTPALAGEVDLVVHGGDIFHRSRVPPSLVYQAFRPLVEVADSGVPVFVVPGNHERSRIPHARFASHPNLHIFHRPMTVAVQIRQVRVAVAGFPYVRRGIREGFPRVLEETGWRREDADLRLLCLHHCVEGATVGPSDYTFRESADVIRCTDLPEDFAAILSGHIHRHQILRSDLEGRPLPTPVIYPGSIERTAFAEMDEEKGFVLMDVEADSAGGHLVHQIFRRLPARPMLMRDLRPDAGPSTDWNRDELETRLAALVSTAPRDAVLQVRVHGGVPQEIRGAFSAPRLRTLFPPQMNLQLLLVEERNLPRRRGSEWRPAAGEDPKVGAAGDHLQLTWNTFV